MIVRIISSMDLTLKLTLEGNLINKIWPGHDFDDSKLVSNDEIFEETGGFLKNVTHDDDDTVVVYKTYDHHNNPIVTTRFNSDGEISDTVLDWSRTKYQAPSLLCNKLSSKKIEQCDYVMSTLKHAWYSYMAATRNGCYYYSTPQGNKVTVTEVSDFITKSNFPDTKYVGLVTEYIGCDSIKRQKNKRLA